MKKVKLSDPPHDCRGKIALNAFKVCKSRCNMLENQIETLNENYANIKDDYLNVEKYLSFYK